MIKFSIIIPVYNVEKYIHKCIDSVIKQSYGNIEVILVNDGSPDNCGNICEEYHKMDNRVKVIHKENGGLSSARNAGINIVTGDYIIFLDSDDWIENDFIKRLYNYIKSNDFEVIVVSVKAYFEDTNEFQEKIYNIEEKTAKSGYEVFKYLYNKKSFWGAAWQFVVKKDFWVNNGMMFEDGIYHEDELYSPELLLLANKVGFCNNAFYVNRSERSGSIINSYNIKKEFDKVFIIKALIKLSETPKFIGIKSELLKWRCSQMYVGLVKSSYKYLKNNEIKSMELKKQIQSMESVLKYNKNKKYKIFYFGIKIFGVKVIGRMLNKGSGV